VPEKNPKFKNAAGPLLANTGGTAAALATSSMRVA
jgi:hypothetical protein